MATDRHAVERPRDARAPSRRPRLPHRPRDRGRGLGGATNIEGARLRRAVADDGGRIAGLLGELGYPTEPKAVERRLERLLASRAIALVADAGGEVVALCTIHLFDVIHEDTPVAMLSVLVVSAQARRRGIGRSLVNEAEQWARASGAGRVVIASGLARADAHGFYESLGYQHNARRYSKRLDGR
ncbi:MAG: hypothetical protein DMF78_10380 [Acidobacteria bacterium]|nr:MAG: hypothetical protein DMF78_10380 [Acidobacteriota bacterium]